MKVLLVDDDTDLLDLLAFVLVREGYLVVTAADGADALARWQAEQPDLVVVDVNLPRVDGFEVCRQIRRYSTTPVILLTGRDEAADVARGQRVGANDYVTKPFSHQQLTVRVAAALRLDAGDALADDHSDPAGDNHRAARAY
jgi:DNA-binding response OmpR family regulator